MIVMPKRHTANLSYAEEKYGHEGYNFACMLEISDERLQFLMSAMLLGRAGFEESSNAVKFFFWKVGLKS